MEKFFKANSVMRIITAILFILLGILLVTRPILGLGALVWIVGAVLAVSGIVSLIMCIASGADFDYVGGKGVYIVLCILRILVGFIFVADEFIVVGMLPYFIAGWLTIAGIFKIVQSFMMKKNFINVWYAQLICGIFYVIMAVLMFSMGIFAGAQFVGIVAGVSILVNGVVMLCEPMFKDGNNNNL